MSHFMSIAFISLLSLTTYAKVARPPQYVHLAFDGSKSLSMWKATRDFARNNNVRFTYFISGVYFLTDADKTNYVEPAHGKGKSAIGFGGSKADIQGRLEQVKAAILEGNEVASHANGHFDGGKYSEAQWNSEFSQFTNFLSSAWNRYGVGNKEPNWWQTYFSQDVIGFRAPLLAKSNGLWPALRKHNFAYDTSRIDKMEYWPTVLNGVWNFPLASVRIQGSGIKTISMDYNFYFAQSKAKTAPANMHKVYEDQMFNTYMNYFKNNYAGNRAPIHIGHHFSLWNGGAYWNAMQRFAKAVCNMPEVICGTYAELTEFLNSKGPETIAAYQSGNFDKVARQGVKATIASLYGTPKADWEEITDEDLEELRSLPMDPLEAHEQ